MAPLEVLVYAGLGMGAGLLIGCVGVGGVILVPALVYLVDLPVQVAIAAAMGAFLLSGFVGTYAYAQAGSIRWDMTAWLWLGAVPAAFAGALLVNAVGSRLIELAVGILTTASGVHALAIDRKARPGGDAALSGPALTTIGTVTGFTSAMTGTGGPLVLIPILVWLEIPVLAAIGLAQAIQLPIAAAATGGNLLAGTFDAALALALGCGIVLGTWAGAKAAHVLPRVLLRRFVAGLLVLIGGAILVRLALA